VKQRGKTEGGWGKREGTGVRGREAEKLNAKVRVNMG